MRGRKKPTIPPKRLAKPSVKVAKPAVEVAVFNSEMIQSMCRFKTTPITPNELQLLKASFISTISGSILREPKLLLQPGNSKSINLFTTDLISQSRRIALYDPEFLLKAALYARTRLNLRSVTSFLLSLSALIRACHPYLPRYFNAAVLLPSDWLVVVRRYRVLHATLCVAGAPLAEDLVASGSERSLPSCLRKAMVAKFACFDAYQLGKYNPQRSNARKRRKLIEASQEKTKFARGNEDLIKECEQEMLENERNLVDFKGLIRDLHIVEPAEYVMCVLGKKYPSSEEEFRKCRLSGVFLEERSGQRMKLPVPDTWETYLSEHGNTAETWEALVDKGKLPFMAMLRNIRNLLICGVSQKVHDWVLGKLCDSRSIATSKQLPFRFVSAYKSVPATLEGFAELLKHVQNPPKVERASDGEMVPRRERKHIPSPKVPPTQELLTRYKEALETAIQHATNHNVAPIRGKTLILCDIIPGYKADKDKFRNTTLLLALMCRSVCEDCEFVFINAGSNKIFTLPDDNDDCACGDGIIARLERANKLIEGLGNDVDTSANGSVPKFIHTLICERKWVDTIVYFGSAGINIENDVDKLRAEVNASMLFFAVNPEGMSSALSMPPRKSSTDMNIHVAGASDSVLRYIAELGNANQVEDVEHINREFGIVTDDIPPPPLPSFITKKDSSSKLVDEVENYTDDDDEDDDDDEKHTDEDEKHTDEKEGDEEEEPRKSVLDESEIKGMWKEARIFVSSTFVDMHGERDLITRIVYPELAKRCEEYKIRLSIVDLRWGITESDSKAPPLYAIGGERRPNPQRCLEIVGECAPLFVGFVGERYGWHPAPGERYPIDTEDPRFAWVAKYPKGRSATELEMYLGCAKDRNPHAFFYFRDPSFMDTVPAKYKKSFAAESKAAGERVAALKTLIRSTTDNVITYPATWGGVVDGVPVAKCPNALKRRLFNDMWAMIKSVFDIKEKKPEDKPKNNNKGANVESREVVEMAQRVAAARLTDDFIGHEDVLEELSQWASDESGRGSVCALCGPSGSGISSLCALFASRCRAAGLTVVEHHVSCGGTRASTTLRGMLTRLCLALEKASDKPLGADLYASLTMRDLEARFAELLEEASYTTRTVIVIDSPDDLVSDDGDLARSLGWLPAKPPARGCRILLSLRAGGECEGVLRAKYPLSGGALRTVTLPPLGHDDARALVRQTLERYRKKLSESGSSGSGSMGSGNQMAVLLSKMDAGLPLYLKLACEELRVFGVYEALGDRIKSMSPTLPGLVDEVLSRFENDHGRALVSNALTSLALSRQGLYESELLRILAPRKSAADSSSPLPLLPQGRWAPLCVVLRAAGFVTQTAAGFPLTIAAAPAAFRAVVERRYLTPDYARRVHARIAECLAAAPRSDEGRRLSDIVHHYVQAGMHSEAAALLTSLAFVRHKIELGMGPGLLSDYAEYLHAVSSAEDSADVAEFRDFVSANMHILALGASLTYQLAANEPDATAPARAALRDLKGKCGKSVPGVNGWVKWINKPQQCGLRKMRLGGSSDALGSRACATSCVAFSPALVAYGCNDCSVRVHDRTTGKLIATLTQHSAAVSALAFSDDGEALAAGAWDGAVWVWSTHTWAALPAPLRAPKFTAAAASSRRIAALAFPRGSRSRVLAASWDSNIYIWDFSLGSGIAADPTCYVLSRHQRPVSALCIADDGRRAASAAWDGSVLVWDISERKMVGELPKFSGSIRSLAWRPDSSEQLIVAATNGSVELWNTAPPVRLAHISDGTDPVNAALYCGDAAVATGAEDGALRLWAASSTKPLWGGDGEDETDDVHALPAPSKMLALSGDGTMLVAPAGDCMAYLWSVGVDEDRTLVKSGRLAFHKKVVNAAAVESSGKFVVTVSDDGNVALWNEECLNRARRCNDSEDEDGVMKVAPKVLHNAGCPVNDVALIKRGDGKYAVVCALENSTLVVLDSSTGTVLGNLKGKWHGDSVLHVTVSPDASYIASASLDGTVCIWDASSYAHIRTITAHKDWVTGLLFTPDSRHIITSSLDSRCQLFDARSGALVRSFPRVPGPVTSLALSPGGTFLAAACSSGAVCVWDRAAGFLLSTLSCPANTASPALCFLCERALAAAVDGSVLRAWRLLCPHELVRLAGHNGPVRSAALSPDAAELATAADDGAVCLWDVKRALDVNPAQMRWQAQNHTAAVTAAAFAADGKTFVTAAADGSLKMWDAAAACVRTFYPSGEKRIPVRSVAFDVDGSSLLAGDACGNMYVFGPDGTIMKDIPNVSNDAISGIKFVSEGTAIACSWGKQIFKLSKDGDDLKSWTLSSEQSPCGEKVSPLLRCGLVAVCDANDVASFRDPESLAFVSNDVAPFMCSAHINDSFDVFIGASTGSKMLDITMVSQSPAGSPRLRASRDPRARVKHNAVKVNIVGELDVGAPVVAAEFARSEFESENGHNVLVVATADNKITLYEMKVDENEDDVNMALHEMNVFMTKAKPSVVAVSPVSQAIVVGDVLGMVYLLKYVRMRK